MKLFELAWGAHRPQGGYCLGHEPARSYVLHRSDDKNFQYQRDGVSFTIGLDAAGLLDFTTFAAPTNRPGPYDGYAALESDSFVSVGEVPL